MAKKIYIERLIDKNVGPISDLEINFSFIDNGDPKPVVFVGENGTGKTALISNIADAFYEMAGKAFSNAIYPNGTNGYQYFKAIMPSEIHTGASYLYYYISFSAKNTLKYVFKSGKISVDTVKKQTGDNSLDIAWQEDENKKIIIADTDIISDIWAHNVLCYMGPDRYEKPAWMGDQYYQTEEFLHPTVRSSYNGQLKNPIDVKNVTSLNLQWLLDVIADSRADIEGDPSSMKLASSINANNMFLLKQARNNLEKILSKILGDDVYFQLNYRNSGGSRFRIVKRSDNSVVCPTLDSLSTGQIALFNLFATIIRYADNNNIDQSIHLDDITGIVIIDEIELHLHSKLQKEVLPSLLQLFPKIQFIITSHSPLFLLGMKDTFGEEGFDVYELPDAHKISVECFSEFYKAYDYFKKTHTFQKEINDIVDSLPQGETPLVITEGPTDWKHMETALNVLSVKDEYKDLFENLCFDFLKYESKNSSLNALLKIEMGNEALIPLCESLIKIPHNRKYIIIADRDTPKFSQKIVNDGTPYKKWDDNTYSALLPLPEFRADTPEICIEHYYSDDEIEKEIEINGISRHLYMGKDFNSHGFNYSADRFCERKDLCGPGKINIIDGTQGERIKRLSDDSDQTNYALSKSAFADYVSSHPDEFDFTNFIPLFKMIKTIIGNDL